MHEQRMFQTEVLLLSHYHCINEDLDEALVFLFVIVKWTEVIQLSPCVLVTSVTPRQTPMDSERDFGNGLNHYPHFTSFPFPISSCVLSQLLIHNLLSLLPYPRIVTAASAAELLPSINM
jgi:hypothetical protein